MADAGPGDDGRRNPSGGHDSRDNLPGRHTSPWLAENDGPHFPSLEGAHHVDVAIVGAGIAGLSTAFELADAGRRVAVLEGDRIGTGVTGRSTAKVTSQHGLRYDHLRREFGADRARQYASVNEAAIDIVETRVDALGIDCGFERRPAYVYGDDRDAIEREVEAARAAGLPASFVTSAPPFERAEATVRFEDQAWFHPRAYLLGIADELASRDGVRIYENSRVVGIDPGSPIRIRTGDGSILADHAVLATGFPILDRAGYFARMYPKRSYVLAVRIDGQAPDAMYYRHDDPYRSVRTHHGDDGPIVLVGGENHKTGQGGSTVDRYRRLAVWARERFPVRSIEYRWSTQDYVTADGVPFVGRAGVGVANVLVATGFGGWGMTGGVVAGRLLTELIEGDHRPVHELYDPLRFTPTSSIGATLTENLDAASQFATDWARALLDPEDAPIEPGEGRVVRRGGRPMALSRDEDGRLHAHSAVCPHMRCVLEWNDAERSWDCPCHGSRFDATGSLLEGPATEDLSRTDPGVTSPREGGKRPRRGTEDR